MPLVKIFYSRARKSIPPFVLAVLAIGTASSIRAGTLTGVYTLSGGTASLTGQTFSASGTDQSAVFVSNGGTLTLSGATLASSGTPSNITNNYQLSSQYGNNACVLVGTSVSSGTSGNGTSASIGTLTISGNSSISTAANGNNGLYATSTGSSITMTGGTVTTTGTFSHGADVTYGGLITLNGTTINTSGNSGSAGLSTDFGGGTVNATNVNVTTAGGGSPPVYSTGTISVTNSTLKGNGGNGGIIDGGNTINLTNTSVTSEIAGIRVFRSAPGSTSATVTINGGSITSTTSDGFFVDGSSSAAAIANITVEGGATITANSGVMVRALSTSAHTTNAATFTASGETLSGNFVTDGYSTITATLQDGTTLTGLINTAATGTDSLTVGSASKWIGMGGSYLTTLSNSGTIASEVNTPGLLGVTGNFAQSSSGILAIELGGTSAGITYDEIAVGGTASLGGILDLDLVDGFTPTLGETFNVLTFGSRSGTFSSITSSDPRFTYSATYNSGNVEITATAVPEPATGTLLLVLVAALGAHLGLKSLLGPKGER